MDGIPRNDLVLAKPLEVAAKAQGTLSKIVTPIPNPCHNGCGYESFPLQCTRWAAIVRERMGYPIPDNLGDAKEWPANAKAMGLEVGDHPIEGAVAISTEGYWGHSMVVTSVLPNGSFMVTEANYDFMGSIRERLVTNAIGLTFIYY